MAAIYTATASFLNLRSEPGVESQIITILPRGTSVEFVSASDIAGWWKVRLPNAATEGYVARQYLAAQSDGGVPGFNSVINDIIWKATVRAEGHVRYLLGAKHSITGKIDCSGWVAELTSQVFTALNVAAAPEVVFHRADFRVLENHSDGIISGTQNRTGQILKGAEISLQSLHEGMLIGCNFSDYKWEHNIPPRVYGIDHIVQVVREPETGTLYITQSSGSGNGVNKVPLSDWLRERDTQIRANKLYAVDPFALADRHSSFAQRTAGIPPEPALVQPAVINAPSPLSNRLSPFSGLGFYIYSSIAVVQQYASAAAAIQELQQCKIQNIWVRIHGRGYVGESKGAPQQALQNLIAEAKNAGLLVAGWGWLQGEDPVEEAALASKAMRHFGLDAYVADIEEGVNGAQWTAGEVIDFVRAYRKLQSGPLCVTSHGFIDWHAPEIFSGLSAAGVDCVNPQAYWYESFPNKKMLNAVLAQPGMYKLHDPLSYVRLCADRWSRYGLPIVVAGLACPDADFSSADTLDKLQQFITGYERPPNVIGVNFWHWGATDQPMRDAIATWSGF